MLNKKLKRPYWNIDSNFNFYFEDKIKDDIGDIWKKLKFQKLSKNIFKYKNKKILFKKITTYGMYKNGKINRLRININGNSIDKNIDFILGFHKNTELFFLFEKNIITKSQTSSSLLINLEDFLYFKYFKYFKNIYKTNDRNSLYWVFKDENILFQLLENKKLLFNEKDIKKTNKINKYFSEIKKLLLSSKEHKEFINYLNNQNKNKEKKFEINKNLKNSFQNNFKNKKNIKKNYSKRLNQSLFRSNLLINYHNECLLTKISLLDVLEACHIKPNSVCDDLERMDPKNGILMDPKFHKLFDKGLFTFDKKFKIIYSEQIDNKNKKLILDSIKSKEDYPNILKILVDQKYLEYHRKNIFKIS